MDFSTRYNSCIDSLVLNLNIYKSLHGSLDGLSEDDTVEAFYSLWEESGANRNELVFKSPKEILNDLTHALFIKQCVMEEAIRFLRAALKEKG